MSFTDRVLQSGVHFRLEVKVLAPVLIVMDIERVPCPRLKVDQT